MPTDEHDAESRKEQLSQGVEKAKEGAKKLAGWLGKRLGDAAEQIREAPAVRGQMEKLEQFQEERRQAQMFGSLESIYDDWSERLQRAIESIQADADAHRKAKEAVDYNINELRNRGISSTDDELRGYVQQAADLRGVIEECHAAEQPFREEYERMQRQRRAAVAQLEAEPGQVEALREQAIRQVTESRERLPRTDEQQTTE